MRKEPKLYPIVPALFVLAIGVYLAWSAHTLYRYTQSTDSENSLILSVIITLGNTVPIFLVLLFLTRLSWRTYQNQRQVLATWQKNKQTVARITLDLDAHDVTFLTIPENLQTAKLKSVYRQLHELCLELLQQQSDIESVHPGSVDFRLKVHKYTEKVEHLSQLASTLVASGNYYGPAQNIQTVFDVLINPLEFRAREILFFLEDTPGKEKPSKLVSQFRESFENLRAIVNVSHQHRGGNSKQLDGLLRQWKVAESNLAQAAHSLTSYFQGKTVEAPHYGKTWVLSGAEQGVSLHLLRRTLGLPTQGSTVAEIPLEEAARLSYLHSSQDWRPRSQRPGYTGRMSIPEALKVRAYLSSEDETIFKARVFSARFDAMAHILVPRPALDIFTKVILALGTAVAALLALLSFAIISSGTEDLAVMGASTFFIMRYLLSSALTLAVLSALPLLAFLLVRATLLYVFSGNYLLAGEQKRRLSALATRLTQLLLSLETTQLDVLTAQNPPQSMSTDPQVTQQNRFLSTELIERRLALPQRGIAYYQALPRSSQRGIEGKNLLTDIEFATSILAEEYHDAAQAADAALKR